MASQSTVASSDSNTNKVAAKESKSFPHKAVVSVMEEDYYVTPDFIYGGPFISVRKPSSFIDTGTPINVNLQGTFRKSFAYFSIRDRLPVILTRIIDYISRERERIEKEYNISSRDVVQAVAKIKNDLITNKEYEPFKLQTKELKKWNEWIENQQNKKYFNNDWIFTECYIYRKIFEACEANKNTNFDYFEEQKNQAFQDNVEIMCLVSDKVCDMLPKSEKDKRKADFIMLMKIALWANKCDLSLSLGEGVSLKFDPIKKILEWKDKLLVDESAKAADQVFAKSDALAKAIQGSNAVTTSTSPARVVSTTGTSTSNAPSTANAQTSPTDPAAAAAPPAPKPPCPAKMVIPFNVMFDIVCDNAGYELFADMCIGAFLLEQELVQKVRFHLKKMPWFVSDATPKDFNYVINSCINANYKREVTEEPEPAPAPAASGKGAKAAPPPPPESSEPKPPVIITSDNLKKLGALFKSYVDNGKFVLLTEDYWTWPHVYRDMKKYDYNLYRKLQYSVAILFKGDLNYRKLLCEKNVNPYSTFEAALQGFMPAPIIAIRTVKCELICAMPKGKYEQLMGLDEHWMEKGDYGVIHFLAKAEPLKVAEKPCVDYGEECFGVECPDHKHDM